MYSSFRLFLTIIYSFISNLLAGLVTARGANVHNHYEVLVSHTSIHPHTTRIRLPYVSLRSSILRFPPACHPLTKPTNSGAPLLCTYTLLRDMHAYSTTPKPHFPHSHTAWRPSVPRVFVSLNHNSRSSRQHLGSKHVLINLSTSNSFIFAFSLKRRKRSTRRTFSRAVLFPLPFLFPFPYFLSFACSIKNARIPSFRKRKQRMPPPPKNKKTRAVRQLRKERA